VLAVRLLQDKDLQVDKVLVARQAQVVVVGVQ
jgi:hypothetical protein